MIYAIIIIIILVQVIQSVGNYIVYRRQKKLGKIIGGKNMKFTKLFGTVGAFLLLSAGALAGTLKVGATPVPHAEILELIKPDLKKQGVDLKIVEFTDYVTPNLALSDKEIDANFFQHKPYLDKFVEERKLNLVSLGNVHVEPLGLYSKKIKSINDLKKGDTIAIPNDPSNGGRALILLHNKGVYNFKRS